MHNAALQFENPLWVEAAESDGGNETGNADEDADDENAQLDPVDFRRCAHPDEKWSKYI